ncbi:MAG: D-aminoacyl-tRNA deacylase, partial [Dehalococcoidales bacterium]|nr:D-aminoacyl-tRNA deacylase [Dehalococcoidales bacterium]
LADARKGRRPSFTDAAPPAQAEELFNEFVSLARQTGLNVATGRFQQHMLVEILNDGPVTIMLDSRDKLGKPEE